MGVIKKIQYNCRHATYLIEKRQHRPLTVKEWVQLMIHLSGCSVCRLFQRQSRMINKMVKGVLGRQQKLDDDFKRAMQQEIEERLTK